MSANSRSDSERRQSLMTLKGTCQALDILTRSANQQLVVQQRREARFMVPNALRDLPDDIVKYIFEVACLPGGKDSIAPFWIDNAKDARQIALAATRLSHVDRYFRKVALQQPLLWCFFFASNRQNRKISVWLLLGSPSAGRSSV